MNSFSKGKVGDLLTLQRGFDITKKEQTDGIYPVVSSGGVSSYHNKFMAAGPGVVIGRKGTLGSAFYIETDFWPHDTTLWVKDFKGSDPKFIYYFLKTLRLERLDSGSSNPTLNRNFVHQLDANKPEPKTQKKISEALSALDAKIDCNNRVNAELEAMAKTLFDYWFVQLEFPDANGKPYKFSAGKMEYNATLKREIPVGWTASSIVAVADLLGGGTPTKKKPEYWGGDIPFFTPTDADGTIFKFSTEDYITDDGLKGSSTKLFSKNTVFITARGSVGRLVLAGVDMTMNQSCYALRAKPGISHVFLFFLAKELIHHLQVKSSGSVFNSIVSNDIELTNLAIPEGETIKKFAAVVEPFFEKIANNTKENLYLAKLRDWLLPMLMNGQVTTAEKEQSIPCSTRNPSSAAPPSS
jgi:type I restriction enzyme S subunit